MEKNNRATRESESISLPCLVAVLNQESRKNNLDGLSLKRSIHDLQSRQRAVPLVEWEERAGTRKWPRESWFEKERSIQISKSQPFDTLLEPRKFKSKSSLKYYKKFFPRYSEKVNDNPEHACVLER